MISVCLPSDALLQHLLSYLSFSFLGRGVSLHSSSRKVQLLLFTLDEAYLLTTTPPDLERGIAALGPPEPAQPSLLGRGVAPPSCRPWPQVWGCSSQLLLCCHSLAISAATPDLGRGVTPLGHAMCPVAAAHAMCAATATRAMCAVTALMKNHQNVSNKN